VDQLGVAVVSHWCMSFGVVCHQESCRRRRRSEEGGWGGCIHSEGGGSAHWTWIAGPTICHCAIPVHRQQVEFHV